MFRAFLQMLAEGKLPDLFNPGEKYLTRTVSRYRKLFKFAAKWQCTAVTLLLQQSLYKMIHQSAGGPLVAFVFGTVINDLDLCATSLKFPMAKYDPEGKGVEQFVFDTSFWPNWAWDICTTPLTAALAQAWVATAGNRSLLSAKFSEKLLTFRAEKLRRDKGELGWSDSLTARSSCVRCRAAKSHLIDMDMQLWIPTAQSNGSVDQQRRVE